MEVGEVEVAELEALLRCEVVEELMDPEAVLEAVAATTPSSVEVESSESSKELSEPSSEDSSEVGEALLGELDVLVADPAPLPVAAVSGTALPAEHVMFGTPLMMPWFGSPRQQVKSLASLLLPVPPIREPSQQYVPIQAPEELEPTTKSWPAMRAGEMARRREAMRRAIVVVGWLDG